VTCVVLIGPRGAGKTALGQRAARRLGWAFLDTDRLIEAKGRSVAAIFAAAGEAGFRAREREVIGALAPAGDAVIATGGGAVLDAGNRAHLAALGPVIYLHAPPEELVARIAGTDRPALSDADPRSEMRAVLARREPLYRDLADALLDTGTLGEDAAVEALVALARALAEKR
jgi:shikimate kinase